MDLFKNIRLKIGKSALAKKIARTKRNVRYSDISLVKTIGIVWDASKTTDFPGLAGFHHKMHERGIEVTILGYYEGKELPDQYTAIRYLTFIRRNEINSYYHPVTAEANSFIKHNFDILIDLNFKDLFPLRCVSALSNASLKVGLLETGSENTMFDIMMDIKYPSDIENYLNQVMHYLEMINSGSSNSKKNKE
jgi:hypothetical protein